jgi:hypothetical protein
MTVLRMGVERAISAACLLAGHPLTGVNADLTHNLNRRSVCGLKLSDSDICDVQRGIRPHLDEPCWPYARLNLPYPLVLSIGPVLYADRGTVRTQARVMPGISLARVMPHFERCVDAGQPDGQGTGFFGNRERHPAKIGVLPKIRAFGGNGQTPNIEILRMILIIGAE